MKNINYLNKNKSKNYIGFNIEKRKQKYISCLKRQIIKLVRLIACLRPVDTTFIIK